MDHSTEQGGHGNHGEHGHGMDKSTLMVIHGALMLLGWCVLLPLGIMASIFRARLNGEYDFHVLSTPDRCVRESVCHAARVCPEPDSDLHGRRWRYLCRRAADVAEMA
jgi:hypothetical protein